MPKKSASPEAAQRKVWRAEMKDLATQYRALQRECTAHLKAAQREVDSAAKALEIAQRKRDRTFTRIERGEPRALRVLDARIAVLRGRLGL